MQAVTDRGSTTTNGATFGGGNISLSANGSATFIGTVKQGTFNGGQTTASGSVFIDGGGVMTQFEAATTAATNRAFVVYHGGNEQIEFKGDGSGSFAGSVQSKSWPTTGYQLEGSGGLGLTAAAGTTGNMIALKVDGTSVASITGQGEAEFSGDVTVGEILTGSSDKSGVRTYEAGYVAVQKEAGDNTHLWLGYQGNAVKSQINADGSASFSGGNCEVSSDGLLRVKRSAANGSAGLVVYPDNNFSVAAVAAINTDGSANFANRVFTADLVAGSTDYTGPYFFAGPTEIALNTNQSTPVFKVKDDGSAVFDARVSGSVSTIPNNSAFALTDSNFWTAAGGTWVNPTEATPGQSGVIYVQTEVNAFGNFWSFPGGVTPTIPANSVVPYYVESSNKIRLGLATEAFV